MAWSPRTRIILALAIGYFCIFVFFSLTTYIIYVFYTTIAQSVLKRKEYVKFIFHFTFGNWLGINIYFNYLMAWLTSPGLAKDYHQIAKQYPICKKCLVSKPPRTHHCSWCHLCILKFDHHCPWLNNCVGFYNHRYFFQFCCYMTIGCFYAGIFGFREYQISRLGKHVFGYKESLFNPFEILDRMGVVGFITYFIYIAALTIGFMLIGLTLWHGRLISNGVTSLERVLNQDYAVQCQSQGYLFVNPYDFGFLENWKRFLGVRTRGEFIRRVLLPSAHKPIGDGITWDGFNVNTNLHAHRYGFGSPHRPIAYPPDTYSNARFRPVVPPWEKQSKPVPTEESRKDT